MNVWPSCLDVGAVNVALIPSAKTSHPPCWCIVSLSMSKFVHLYLWPHVLDYTSPFLCFVIWFISACFFCLLFLFLSYCSAIRITNLRSSKTKIGTVLFFSTVSSFIYSSIWANPHPNPSNCLSGSLTWFIVEYSVMLKATSVCTQSSCLRYT